MNVLFTMTGSWGTGSGTVIEALTAELSERGHRVCVLYPETAEAPETGFEHAPAARHEVWPFPLHRDGVALYTYPLMIPDPNPSNFEGAWTFRDLSQAQIGLYVTSFQARLREVVADFRPDVIECQHVWLMPFAVSELGLPYFVTAHHSDQMGFAFDERIRPYARQAAQRAEAIFALTETNRAEVVQLYDVPPERVVMMGNGYDRTVFRPLDVDRAALLAEHGLDIPPESPLVTFAGKLSKTKGVDLLLAANRRLQDARRAAGEPPVHLLLFGTGTLEDVLDPEQEATYSLEHVHLLGHQAYETVRDVHNMARCSVMPSRTEGFGLAALEAMGCGLPVIVTAIGAADTYAVGAVVPPEDPEALAEAMLRLVRMPEPAYQALRDRALARAQTFSWGTITEKRLEYFRQAPPMPRDVRPSRPTP